MFLPKGPNTPVYSVRRWHPPLGSYNRPVLRPSGGPRGGDGSSSARTDVISSRPCRPIPDSSCLGADSCGGDAPVRVFPYHVFESEEPYLASAGKGLDKALGVIWAVDIT